VCAGVVLGLRQAGKTTPEVEVGQEFNALFLDLESWMGSQASAQW
jgi:shikimate kinase